ncbi:trehalose-6-phosphate synthase [Streptomyces sp. NPDC005438]|uniref:alpha,alpha-trehalose-phosphate synthase (UDP-forming) n=1 Tax=Streptomyces sp. NPDC005438 TaxID=3156880 RepID=UPI0033A53ACA
MPHPTHAPPEHGSPLLVASNRGPVSYSTAEDGTLSARRGGGGLVSGLSAIDPEAGAVWVCAALSDADRLAAARSGGRLDPADTGGQAVRMVDIDPEVFRDAYDQIANSVLWFVHHMLYQTPLEPAFDSDFAGQWASYERYNRAFAETLAQEAAEGATVLVQDYHLTLTPGMLRALRPDLRVGHFSHTPWAPPDYFRMLPARQAEAVLRGVLGADRAAFLTPRWASAFVDCCVQLLGAREEGRPALPTLHGGPGEPVDTSSWTVTLDGHTTRIGVHGLGADATFLRERAARPDVDERRQALREQIGHTPEGAPRHTVVRVDRTELSKNIVRGLHAYRRLLTDRPEWRERVVHLAFAYPSRQDLALYRSYTEEVSRVAEEINSAFGTDGWTPVLLHVRDDFARSLAAYQLADVALVNPIRDGMNLVAKEVPVLSERGCALVLSQEAGAHEELGRYALVVNPYDITGTADALHTALTMDDAERRDRCAHLVEAATALPPTEWFLQQLQALRG